MTVKTKCFSQQFYNHILNVRIAQDKYQSWNQNIFRGRNTQKTCDEPGTVRSIVGALFVG